MDSFTPSDGRFTVTIAALPHETGIQHLRSLCINRQTKANEHNRFQVLPRSQPDPRTGSLLQQAFGTFGNIMHKQIAPSASSTANQAPRPHRLHPLRPVWPATRPQIYHSLSSTNSPRTPFHPVESGRCRGRSDPGVGTMSGRSDAGVAAKPGLQRYCSPRSRATAATLAFRPVLRPSSSWVRVSTYTLKLIRRLAAPCPPGTTDALRHNEHRRTTSPFTCRIGRLWDVGDFPPGW
jgi:hypothetical protein